MPTSENLIHLKSLSDSFTKVVPTRLYWFSGLKDFPDTICYAVCFTLTSFSRGREKKNLETDGFVCSQ